LIKIKEAVIVEGKYDKIKLSSIIDGLIIETRGFQIFSDKKQMDLIRRLADTRGILVLTDSDGAGFIIRNYLTGAIPPEKIKHAYIPDILGKEKRKDKPSKEGKLGVEGVSVQTIIDALSRAGVVCGSDEVPAGRKITKTDLYLAGLSGSENSAQKRQELLRELSLPEHLAANSLVGVLNSIMDYDGFSKLLDKIFKKV
jgi:ribonuclease M5